VIYIAMRNGMKDSPVRKTFLQKKKKKEKKEKQFS
jgi:hypothetical protein